MPFCNFRNNQKHFRGQIFLDLQESEFFCRFRNHRIQGILIFRQIDNCSKELNLQDALTDRKIQNLSAFF